MEGHFFFLPHKTFGRTWNPTRWDRTLTHFHDQEICIDGTVSASQGYGTTLITSWTPTTQLPVRTPCDVCHSPLLPQPPQLPLPGQC